MANNHQQHHNATKTTQMATTTTSTCPTIQMAISTRQMVTETPVTQQQEHADHQVQVEQGSRCVRCVSSPGKPLSTNGHQYHCNTTHHHHRLARKRDGGDLFFFRISHLSTHPQEHGRAQTTRVSFLFTFFFHTNYLLQIYKRSH